MYIYTHIAQCILYYFFHKFHKFVVHIQLAILNSTPPSNPHAHTAGEHIFNYYYCYYF